MVKWISLLEGLTLQNEIIAGVIVAFNSLLAAAGGVGGGPIYTSILLAFGASVHSAIPIPQVIIFSGSLGLFFFNATQKMATNKLKPAIQWDLVFFLENSVVVGTIIGALLNLILPSWFLLGSELFFFTYEGVNSMVKGIKGLKADKQKFKNMKSVSMHDIMKAELEDANLGENQQQQGESPLIIQEKDDRLNSAETEPKTVGAIDLSPTSPLSATPIEKPNQKRKLCDKSGRKRDLCSHWRSINRPRLITFLVIFFSQMLLQVWRRFVKSCSAVYWLLFAVNVIVGIIAIVINDILLNQSIKHNRNDLLLGVGIEKFKGWKSRIKLVSVGFLAGIVAATLGLGGGLIKQPLMLGIGVPPYVARLASQTMILFTSLTASVGFVAQGQVDFSQVWPFMIIAAITFPIGFFLSDLVIKCVKSTQVINLSIAVLLLISDIFVGIQFVKACIEMAKTGVVEGFRINALCK